MMLDHILLYYIIFSYAVQDAAPLSHPRALADPRALLPARARPPTTWTLAFILYYIILYYIILYYLTHHLDFGDADMDNQGALIRAP